jgi:hypothetical protein
MSVLVFVSSCGVVSQLGRNDITRADDFAAVVTYQLPYEQNSKLTMLIAAAAVTAVVVVLLLLLLLLLLQGEAGLYSLWWLLLLPSIEPHQRGRLQQKTASTVHERWQCPLGKISFAQRIDPLSFGEKAWNHPTQ